MGNVGSSNGEIGFQPMEGKEITSFAAGCFWGVEKSFAKKFASKDVELLVGYCGGSRENPTYRAVCSGTTGHAEAIQIRYDPTKVTYEELSDFFFRMHDPTQRNRQGNDVGSQYRSAIFYTTPDQKIKAEQALKLAQTHYGKSKIQTTIEPQGTFWKAEQYHQRYLEQNPHGYECPTHFERSWEKIERMFN
ncbi:Peptide-methionine (S)-S-oxide reductase [Blyttiomyces sp. JEL0837]|nr:Peptide-methionine (S)-S-oxide reductase [Blyttiomyces sp. JEL0837]